MGGQAVLIIGVGGTGKSHLAAQLAESDEHDAVVLRATPSDGSTPLGPFRNLIGDPQRPSESLREHLGPSLLVVDDAHHLDPEAIAALDGLIALGGPVVICMRPTPRRELLHLRDRVEAVGDVIETGPLTVDVLGGVLAEFSGRPTDSQDAERIHDRSGGLVRWARAVAAGDDSTLTTDVGHELDRCSLDAAALARVLAVAPDVADSVLAAGVPVDIEALPSLQFELHSAGLLDPVTEALWPAVRDAVVSDSSGPDVRATRRRLAAALLDRGGEAIDAAEHLRAAGQQDADSAEVFLQAGDELRFRDPGAALAWYDEAAAAGTKDARLVVGVMEATLFGGRTPADATGSATDWTEELSARATAVEAAAAARAGRSARCVEILHGLSGHPFLGPTAARRLATPAQVATGGLADISGRDADSAPAPTWIGRLAEATLGAVASGEVEPAPFVEACEAFERWEPGFVPPDTPHAVAALALLHATDLVASASVLDRADRSEAGGPGFADRRRLLLAWTRMRQARYELPLRVLEEIDTDGLSGRDRLVAAALDAGIARRCGDVPRMRQAWRLAEDVLIAGGGDLLHQELLGELVLSATRLRDLDRAAPVLGMMRHWVSSIDGPHPWRVPHQWLELQLAIEGDDPAAVSSAAAELGAAATDRRRDRVLERGARLWDDLANGRVVDTETVATASEDLCRHGYAWEGSRLAGRAATDSEDPGDARRLLEIARRLHRNPVKDDEPSPVSAGLTEREVEIGRYVVDGLTYREIGTALYISPKTVEHHVARIRRKLLAESRAEMLAALRELLADD